MVEELAKRLEKTKVRLGEWRASAARAGADEVLQFVLSWYEGIDLEVLKTMRSGSKWSETEELVALRKEHAYRLASYAETKGFIEGPPEPESDDEEEEGSEVEGSEIEEEVDEEIEAEANPATITELVAPTEISPELPATAETATTETPPAEIAAAEMVIAETATECDIPAGSDAAPTPSAAA